MNVFQIILVGTVQPWPQRDPQSAGAEPVLLCATRYPGLTSPDGIPGALPTCQTWQRHNSRVLCPSRSFFALASARRATQWKL